MLTETVPVSAVSVAPFLHEDTYSSYRAQGGLLSRKILEFAASIPVVESELRHSPSWHQASFMVNCAGADLSQTEHDMYIVLRTLSPDVIEPQDLGSNRQTRSPLGMSDQQLLVEVFRFTGNTEGYQRFINYYPGLRQ